jgi:hypothetical protein
VSTATVTAGQETIDRGWAVHRRACQSEWPPNGGRVIARTLTDLHDALDLYGSLRDGITLPAAEWPDLEDEPEATALALGRAAEDAGEWADELVRLLPACGTEEGKS